LIELISDHFLAQKQLKTLEVIRYLDSNWYFMNPRKLAFGDF
jgi:hypothetical protein